MSTIEVRKAKKSDFQIESGSSKTYAENKSGRGRASQQDPELVDAVDSIIPLLESEHGATIIPEHQNPNTLMTGLASVLNARPYTPRVGLTSHKKSGVEMITIRKTK